jgi:hypothetical protein
LPRQGRLGNVQTCCGTAKVQFVADKQEVAQAAEVNHVLP